MPARAGCVVRAFSLLEVLIAVALFAGSVTVILAFLPGLTRQSTDTADRLAAQRLPDAVRLEMTRLAAPGLDSLAGKIPVMSEAPAAGFALVATRNSARVQARDEPPSTGSIATEDQYFLIECRRFPDAPLRYETGDPVLALCVRVSWPVSASPASSGQQELMFTVAINR